MTEAPALSAVPEPEEAPEAVLALPAAVVAKLVELELAVAQAASTRDTYQAGLCAGLGIDPARVTGLDTVRGVLVLAPDDAP